VQELSHCHDCGCQARGFEVLHAHRFGDVDDDEDCTHCMDEGSFLLELLELKDWLVELLVYVLLDGVDSALNLHFVIIKSMSIQRQRDKNSERKMINF
jgi:hypothetical protein